MAFNFKYYKIGNCGECGEDVSSTDPQATFNGLCANCEEKNQDNKNVEDIKLRIEIYIEDVDLDKNVRSSYGIPKRYLESTLANFVGDVKPSIEKWIGSRTNNLLIQSPKAGNGKTHLAIASMCEFLKSLGGEMLERSVKPDRKDLYGRYKLSTPTAMVVNFSDLMLEIKASFDSNEITEQDVISKYCGYTVLLVDDIGAEKSSDYTQAVIYSILNTRYEDMKPTIITTNLSSGDITGSYGGRILSRIASGDIISLDGKDMRISKNG